MIRNVHFRLQKLARQFGNSCALHATKNFPKRGDQEIFVEPKISVGYMFRKYGLSAARWAQIMQKHPELLTIKQKDVDNTMEKLQSHNFHMVDIASKPMIIYYSGLTLENRMEVLRECGIQTITISLLSKYLRAMNKSIVLLKAHNFIPYTLDVVEHLRTRFTDVQLHIPSDCECNEDMELKKLRENILNCYLRQRLDMKTADIEKLWKVYSRVRHKSYRSVKEMIALLIDELQFPKDRIVKNAYLLHGDVDNARRMLQRVPKIGNQDMREIVYKRPKILMSSCDSVLKTLEHVRSFGIAEDAVLRCLEVLTLGPDTVLERLHDLHEIEEFQVLDTNPRIMRLVHYQNKARLRLEYLNQLKVRCASLHILSCGSEAFAKFARDGSDRTKGRDVVCFLANIMQKNETNLRALLSRHPHWCHIPVIQVKQCYEYLLSKNFEVEDIYANLHVLLYPIKRIEEKLLQLQSTTYLKDNNLNNDVHHLSNRKILTLILYLIESEFHFTGDGIWTEQHTQHVENFHNLLPDFPESLNKIYKYGVRPAGSQTAETTQHSVQQ